MKGILIATEGIEGSGKTTATREFAARLRKHPYNLDVLEAKEPYTDEWRSFVATGDIIASTADRAAHVREVITPALERGQVVVLDRYYLSGVVYAASDADSITLALRQQRRLFPAPDMWIMLDADPAECVRRVTERDGAPRISLERAHELRSLFDYALWRCGRLGDTVARIRAFESCARAVADWALTAALDVIGSKK